MCGIVGLFSSNTIEGNQISLVNEMNDMLIHRGPNSKGIYTTDYSVIAMRRLSIVDLDGGDQPLFDREGKIALVCNGEIYNHSELREDLTGKGHNFSTLSDVETIIYAYLEYGDKFIKHLRGMFAFALLDKSKQKLILARDRIGEKPLYYYNDEKGNFWFASEIKSLLKILPKPTTLTAEACNLFLTFQYIPESFTPFKNISQLPAGCSLQIDRFQSHFNPNSYWNKSALKTNFQAPAEVIRKDLDEACRLMGTADVPVAVALSGGIDSSLVAAVTSKYYGKDLHAFTIGYTGRPHTDERKDAKELADYLKIGYTEVELRDEDVFKDFIKMISYMDSPIGDIAAYGYFIVSKKASELGFPVLLSGMGGDEMFWGYDWVREAVNRNESYSSRKGWRFWSNQMRGFFGASVKNDFFEVHKPLVDGDKWSRSIMPRATLKKIQRDFWLDKNSLDQSTPVHLSVIELLSRTWLRSNCLALVDRMSMANSVEVRLPLLETNLMESIIGMRNEGLEDWVLPHKALLIDALNDYLPAKIFRRKKKGFTPPVARWMNGLNKRFSPLLRDGSLVRQGLIEPRQLSSGLPNFDMFFLYKLVLLECWCRVHIEKEDIQHISKFAFQDTHTS